MKYRKAGKAALVSRQSDKGPESLGVFCVLMFARPQLNADPIFPGEDDPPDSWGLLGERAIRRFCRLGAGASSKDVGEEDGEREDAHLLQVSSCFCYRIGA